LRIDSVASGLNQTCLTLHLILGCLHPIIAFGISPIPTVADLSAIIEEMVFERPDDTRFGLTLLR